MANVLKLYKVTFYVKIESDYLDKPEYNILSISDEKFYTNEQAESWCKLQLKKRGYKDHDDRRGAYSYRYRYKIEYIKDLPGESTKTKSEKEKTYEQLDIFESSDDDDEDEN